MIVILNGAVKKLLFSDFHRIKLNEKKTELTLQIFQALEKI